MQPIPVMRPKLPVAECIAPYLRQIDSSRIYSNFGPLTRALEARLATFYGGPPETVVSVANGTLGLSLALTVQHPEPGSLCIIPAWTFAATAHAAVLAGLVPYFVDVDPVAWTLDPETMTDEIARAPAVVGAVMPVSPFGQPVDVSAWDRFRAKTGLPVVIDAAAGFDSLIPGSVPAVVSLHATKVLGIGEGGCVVSTDTGLIRELRTRANFGFFRSREAMVSATNAKLSEYHAAIGHAALDEWPTTRAEWMAVAKAYANAFAGSNRIQIQSGLGSAWVTSTCVLNIADAGADRVERVLHSAQIETRKWWGRGAHAHPATERFPRGSLSATESLARSTIGVPFYRDLELSAIERIAECVQSVA